MARYQVLIEYVGTSFRGWQIQKKGSTIQGLIQQHLSKLLKEKIILNGSGRTDAGVHAHAQSAHFDCQKKILDLTKFLKSINHFLNNKLQGHVDGFSFLGGGVRCAVGQYAVMFTIMHKNAAGYF